MKNIQEFSSIIEYKRFAKNLVAESLDSAFEMLKPVVEQNSELYNSWILYKGRHRDTQKFFNQNVFNKNELDLERNKIRSSVLQLIDNLTDSDFQNMIIEVQLNEKIEKGQQKMKEFEERVEKLTNQNNEILNEKTKIQIELEKQKQLNDIKIKDLQIENDKLKNLAENYEQSKKQVQSNEELIEKLKNENKSLNESNKKLSESEKTIRDNHEIIQNLRDEKDLLLGEVENLKKQEKNLNFNKKTIETLKVENTELKHQIQLLKVEIKNNNALNEAGHSPINKKLMYAAISITSILLIFSIIQFVSNQQLNKKLFSLNEQVEDYQHDEADNQINKSANIGSGSGISETTNSSSDKSKFNPVNDASDFAGAVDFSIINSITFNKNSISNGKEIRIERLYKIKEQEGVLSIINRFKMDISAFKKLNPTISDINNVKSGRFIKIYDKVKIKTYNVQAQESLGFIAKKHKMWSYEVLKINGISNPNLLKEGQELFVFSSKYY